MAFFIFPSWFIDGSLTRGVRSNVSSPPAAHTNRLLNCSTNDTWKHSEKKEKEIKKQLDVPSMNYIGLFSSRISMCRRLWLSILGWWWWSNLNFSWNIIQKLSFFQKSPHWTAFTSSCAAQLSHYSDAMSSISRTQVGLLREQCSEYTEKSEQFQAPQHSSSLSSSYSISMRSFFSFLVCLRQWVQSWQ